MTAVADDGAVVAVDEHPLSGGWELSCSVHGSLQTSPNEAFLQHHAKLKHVDEHNAQAASAGNPR